MVYTAFILLDLGEYMRNPIELKLDQLTVPFIVFLCFLGLYLNRKGFSYAGRLSILILWPLFMQILPVINQSTPADYYLAFPLGIIFHSVLIQLIISFKSEFRTYVILMAINLLMLVFTRDFLLFFDDAQKYILQSEIVNSKYYFLDAVLYWLLFNTLTFYMTRVVDQVIRKSDDQQNLLKENNFKLLELNQRIEQVNRTLEDKVKKRTEQLMEVNEHLTSYAYYNAHTIRGPFCRIKGIMMLKDLEAITMEEFDDKINLSMAELELAINTMQERLHEAEMKQETFGHTRKTG